MKTIGSLFPIKRMGLNETILFNMSCNAMCLERIENGINSDIGNPSETLTPYRGESETLQAFFQTYYSRSPSIYLAALREFIDQRAVQINQSMASGQISEQQAMLLLSDLSEFNNAITIEATNLLEQNSLNSVDLQLANELIAEPEWFADQTPNDAPPSP